MTQQKGVAPILILVIVGVVIVGGVVLSRLNSAKKTEAPATEQLFPPELTENEQSDQTDPQIDQVEWETYTSEEYGYSVDIPKGWEVTDTPSENSREITIIHPGAQAIVLITGLKDEGLQDITYMKESMQAFKEKLENDPATTKLTKFQDQVQGDIGGFIALGEEFRSGINWNFEHRGLLSTDGRILLFHGAAQSNVHQQYKGIISKIIESFKT